MRSSNPASQRADAVLDPVYGNTQQPAGFLAAQPRRLADQGFEEIEQRKDEIARMLAGAEITKAARAAAESLMAAGARNQ